MRAHDAEADVLLLINNQIVSLRLTQASLAAVVGFVFTLYTSGLALTALERLFFAISAVMAFASIVMYFLQSGIFLDIRQKLIAKKISATLPSKLNPISATKTTVDGRLGDNFSFPKLYSVHIPDILDVEDAEHLLDHIKPLLALPAFVTALAFCFLMMGGIVSLTMFVVFGASSECAAAVREM